MNPVIQALKFRHACKKFDPGKKISRLDFFFHQEVVIFPFKRSQGLM